MNASVPRRPRRAAWQGRFVLPVSLLALIGSFTLFAGGLDRNGTMVMADETPLKPQPPMPPPRDPEIAVREEYDAAVSAGTVAALTLFIQRHPRHALADLARREIERLESSKAPD
jgi:hypothetical protein